MRQRPLGRGVERPRARFLNFRPVVHAAQGHRGWPARPHAVTTHRFSLEQAMEAYDTFARPGEIDALKVVMTANG